MSLKLDEVKDPNSCLNKAGEQEMVFVLRAKDPAASETIAAWASIRIRMGLNQRTDPKIQGALTCAKIMEDQREQGLV